MKILTLQVGPVNTNCYIAYDEKSLKSFIIDPGDEAIRISAEVGKLGLDIQAIFVTHGHFDHIDAVDRLRTSLEAPSYCSEADSIICASDELNCSTLGIGRIVTCVIDNILTDGEIVDLGWTKITAMLLPGHTHGQMAYYLPEHKIIFTGDNLFKGSYGRHDLPTANFKDLQASLKRLFALPADVTVLPGHGPQTSIGYEAQHNPILSS